MECPCGNQVFDTDMTRTCRWGTRITMVYSLSLPLAYVSDVFTETMDVFSLVRKLVRC